MMNANYKTRMKAVCIILTLCFLSLIGTTLSKVGIMAMSKKDYDQCREVYARVKDDRAYYEMILGDVFDTNGKPILINASVIDNSILSYNKSYSHLLGNIHLDDNGLLNRNYQTLTDKNSCDSVAHKGYSISLTINDDLQRFAYSLTEGQRGSIVVLKRHSGEILALTSTYEQDFDLSGELNEERLSQYYSSSEPVWLPEYLNAYAPGSCQKVFSSAVAFEMGMDDYAINDTGSIKYDNAEITNSGGAIYGDNLGIADAFCYSSNTYFSSLFNHIGIGEIRKFSSSLLLNGSITTDFGEINNTFSFGDYSDFSIGLLGIGQKNELSTIGLAMMTQGCIDNEIYRPHVIKNTCITSKEGSLKVIDTTSEDKLASGIFSDDTCTKVRSLMETAAHSEGYMLNNKIFGAKSGTAEIIVDGVDMNRATLVAYNDDYIVVVSRIVDTETYGISNKDIIEKVFNKLEDF